MGNFCGESMYNTTESTNLHQQFSWCVISIDSNLVFPFLNYIALGTKEGLLKIMKSYNAVFHEVKLRIDSEHEGQLDTVIVSF